MTRSSTSGTSSRATWTGTPISRRASTDSRPRRARRELTGSGASATDRRWSTTNWGMTRPPGSRPLRPSTMRKRSMTAEPSTSRAWPWGGVGCGARMRDRPAAATIWRPLTDPSRQPSVARTQRDHGHDQQGEARPGEQQDGEPDHQAEQHAGGGDDRGGEDLSRRRVAEQEDGLLEAPVDQAPGHAAEDVADGRARAAGRRPGRGGWTRCAGRSRIRPPSRPGRTGAGTLRRRSWGYRPGSDAVDGGTTSW